MVFDLDEFFHDGISTFFCERFQKPATHNVLGEIPNVVLADNRLYYNHITRLLEYSLKVFPVKDFLRWMRYRMLSTMLDS